MYVCHRLIPTRQAAPFHLELFRPSAWIHDGRRSDAFSTRQSLIPRYSHVRSAGRSVFHVAEIRRYDGCSLPPIDELSLGHLVAVALIIMLEDVQQQSPKRRSVCNKNQPPPTSGMSLRGRTAESADRLSSNNSIYYLTTSMFTFSIKIQGLGGIYRLSSLDRLMENIVRGSSVAVDVEEDNIYFGAGCWCWSSARSTTRNSTTGVTTTTSSTTSGARTARTTR